MNILSIHDGHNASAAVMRNGEIVAAAQEERYTRIKNYFGWPDKAIKNVLNIAGLNPEEIDYIAFAGNHTARPPQKKTTSELFISQGRKLGFLEEIFIQSPLYNLYKHKVKTQRIQQVRRIGISCPVEFIDHHTCHASSVYHGMVEDEDEWLVLTLDGSGDGLCATVNVGKSGKIRRIAETTKGHSLGNIYSRTTQVMGFIPWEHEYKLMGMAPYCSEKDALKVKQIFNSYLDLDPSSKLQFKRKIFEPTWRLGPRLLKDLQFLRFDWICGGLQAFAEELIVKWVKACIKNTGLSKVALSGGVFMNVKANKLIMELPEITNLKIMPSCGDESNVFGATYTLQTHRNNSNSGAIKPFWHMYLGPTEGKPEEIENFLQKKSHEGLCEFQRPENMTERIAEELRKGKVIARCAGSMEFGARALGNRSILADPSNLNVIQLINKMIKRRDFWMPFAPVILEERINDYLVNPEDFISPYMMISFDTFDKRRNDLCAAIHPFDYTCRVQTINPNENEDYYAILKCFENTTGRGVLLNTSFNLHGYPIVLNYLDAWEVYIKSELEVLQLGPFIVTKTSKAC